MLVLTRKSTQTIVLELPDGRLIDVEVAETYRNKVRLRLTAPPDVSFLRTELAELWKPRTRSTPASSEKRTTLALTRKAGEQITAELPDGRRFDLTVVALNANKVRVGFEAPRDVSVIRKELLTDAQTQNAA